MKIRPELIPDIYTYAAFDKSDPFTLSRAIAHILARGLRPIGRITVKQQISELAMTHTTVPTAKRLDMESHSKT